MTIALASSGETPSLKSMAILLSLLNSLASCRVVPGAADVHSPVSSVPNCTKIKILIEFLLAHVLFLSMHSINILVISTP